MITTRFAGAAIALTVVVAACGGGSHPGGRAVVQAADDPIAARFTIHTDHGPVRSSTLLDLADSPAAWARGLMGRRDLPPDGGMVFVFDEPTTTSFWMKDTLVPLSLAVWNEDGRIADILDMAPCTADPCERYRPRGPFLGAVEMRRGYFEHNGVEIGDRIDVELLTY